MKSRFGCLRLHGARLKQLSLGYRLVQLEVHTVENREGYCPSEWSIGPHCLQTSRLQKYRARISSGSIPLV